MKRVTLADGLLVAVAIIWGINVVVVKFALTQLGPLPFNSLRFVSAALLSWLLLAATGGFSLPRKQDVPRLAVLGLTGHMLYQVLFISGIARTSAGNTALLLATIPVWVAALAAVTGVEASTGRTWLGISLSFAGIALVTVGGGEELKLGVSWQGDLLIVAGTFFYGWYTLNSRQLLRRYSPLQFTTWTMTIGAAALFLFSLPALARQDWSQVGVAGWGSLAYSSCLAIVAGYYVWINGVQKLGAGRTAIYNNLTPVTAMLAGWLLLGEGIALLQLVGAAMIITGLYTTRTARLAKGQAVSS